MSQDIYKVFCIVSDGTTSFSVKIPKNDTVDDLKELIKAKKSNTFSDIDADALTLYHVNITDDDDLERTLDQLFSSGSPPERLKPTRKLSTVFSGTPPEERVHILVVPPETGSRGPPSKRRRLDGNDADNPDKLGKERKPRVRHSGENSKDSLLKEEGLRDDSEHMQISEESVTTPDQNLSPKLQISPPSKRPNRDIDEVRAQIFDFAEEVRSLIHEFLEESLPLWEPPESVTDHSTRQFYIDQKIPKYRKEPSLLMHNLEKCLQNPKVDKALQDSDDLLIYNTSGSGKTRFILECLCRTWGFYFVAQQGPDRVGSTDLSAAIRSMTSYTDWKGDIFLNTPSMNDRESANDSNCGVAHKLVHKVLIARWVVFRIFIEVYREKNRGTLPDKSKYDWVVFQTLSQNLKSDPFVMCMNKCLFSVESNTLQVLMAQDLNLKDILGPNVNNGNPFLFVLDEAQTASLTHNGCFMDSTGQKKRPVLRPIIQAMLEHRAPIINARIFVSGTGFSHELLKEILFSAVSKDIWKIRTDISTFMDQNTQPSYIAKYLPPPFLQSQPGVNLLSRMYGWLQGRPRFTAHFLQILLRESWTESFPASPHHLLNAFVYALSNYHPMDGPADFLQQEESLSHKSLIGMGSFQWDRISQEQGLLQDLAVTIYQYIIRGEVTILYSSRKALVEYGLARFIDEEDFCIDEPLALVSIVRHFESNGFTRVGNLRRNLQVDLGGTFEDITLYAITRLLRDWKPLNKVFLFHDETSVLASKRGRVVARTSSGKFLPFDIISEQPVVPSGGIATSASNPSEVKDWIEHGTTGWCLPGIYMGPDLLTWIQLEDGRLVLLAIQAKCYLSAGKHLSGPVTASALHTINPRFYYAELVVIFLYLSLLF
ncbi:hypothetical protein FRB91_002127 [Serendipita sp. 411]|nr:hypothetical protein FRB91_002127 [Serendipita sp. 411]